MRFWKLISFCVLALYLSGCSLSSSTYVGKVRDYWRGSEPAKPESPSTDVVVPDEPAKPETKEPEEEAVSPPDFFVLQIDTGRIPVLIDRAWVAAAVIHPELELGDSSQAIFVASFHHARSLEDGAAAELEVHNSLVASMHALDLLQEKVCRASIISGSNCQPIGKPQWIREPTDDHNRLELRVRHTLGLVMPLVNEICDLGATKSGDALICAVE